MEVKVIINTGGSEETVKYRQADTKAFTCLFKRNPAERRKKIHHSLSPRSHPLRKKG